MPVAFRLPVLGVCASLAIVLGCDKQVTQVNPIAFTQPSVKATPETRPAPKMHPGLVRVTKRPANKKGVVFVTEYHNIGEGKSKMFRTGAQFRKDLERLYKQGFRPVTASEYLYNRMKLPPGASPVVMTFDDSQPSQIRLLRDGSLDPNCAMGIWQDFAKEHPDFPMKATFFVLPRMWDQPEFRRKKVHMVTGWGSEIANHTLHHPVLRKKDDEVVKAEIAGGCELLRKYGHTGPILFAAPYGSTPKNRALIKRFKYKNTIYTIDAAFLVGSNPAPAPGQDMDIHRVPRIIAQPGPLGLDYWLNRAARKEIKPYVAP